jgi:hypothetical protein
MITTSHGKDLNEQNSSIPCIYSDQYFQVQNQTLSQAAQFPTDISLALFKYFKENSDFTESNYGHSTTLIPSNYEELLQRNLKPSVQRFSENPYLQRNQNSVLLGLNCSPFEVPVSTKRSQVKSACGK